MVKSMTGYGRVEQTIGDKLFLIELKALNGKQFELQLKLPAVLKTFEFEIRNILQERLQRGSVDCFISLKQNGTVKSSVINTDLLLAYYTQVKEVVDKANASDDGIIGNLLRLPEMYSPSTDVLQEEEFNLFKGVLNDAIDLLDAHRLQEGNSLKKDLMQRVINIGQLEKGIVEFEPKRIERIRGEINDLLNEYVGKENIDQNKMEQELIYYMEKIDIHEEQIRLRQHLDYFSEILNEPEQSKGKKLSFVLQEIGREINTTGSKAYDADIQKFVVQMKDELEKAKEQVLNVL